MEMQTQSRATQASLEEMVLEMWTRCIDGVTDENYRELPVEAVQKLIADTRKIVTVAGWPATYTHDFFVGLAKFLKTGTLGHPTTKQIIRLLEIETEFN